MIDISTKEGTKYFINLSALVAEELEDLDIVSQCVNIRYSGDYDYEDRARKVMECTFVEISYIIIRSLESKLEDLSKRELTEQLSEVIFRIGKRLGFAYRDSDASEFEDSAEAIYVNLKDGKKAKRTTIKRYTELLTPCIGQVYPMADERYKELLSDRDLEWLE